MMIKDMMKWALMIVGIIVASIVVAVCIVVLVEYVTHMMYGVPMVFGVLRGEKTQNTKRGRVDDDITFISLEKKCDDLKFPFPCEVKDGRGSGMNCGTCWYKQCKRDLSK
jgi:hypothetical protein